MEEERGRGGEGERGRGGEGERGREGRGGEGERGRGGTYKTRPLDVSCPQDQHHHHHQYLFCWILSSHLKLYTGCSFFMIIQYCVAFVIYEDTFHSMLHWKKQGLVSSSSCLACLYIC